jgi:transposase
LGTRTISFTRSPNPTSLNLHARQTGATSAEIVELCQRGDRTVRQVSQDFDLTETAVREWVRQAGIDTGTRSDGLTSDERAELAQLRRENRRLREDVDILKRATAFFAKETR